jgi:SNF2 family DNA or RNA helicase
VTLYAPRKYQADTTRFVIDNPKSAQWLDMGLGKTVSMLSAIEALTDSADTRGVLVFGPLRVVVDTWPDEIRKWDHTRRLRYSVVTGTERQRIKALEPGADVYLCNYENMMWLAAYLHQCDAWPFDWVIYDESSKMKAPTTRRFKLWKACARKFTRVNCLSGTPVPEHFLNLWSQYHLIDGGERLGQFFTHFRDKYFRQPYRNSYDWEMRDGAAKQITDRVKDITLAMSTADHLDLPPVVYNNVPVAMPDKARALYDTLHKESIVELQSTTVVAANPAVCSGKCRQFTSGALYNSDDRSTWEEVHTAKLDTLADIVDEMQGQPLLVLYEFRHEIERLRKRWPKAAWIGGGSKGASEIIKNWNARRVPLLFAHPSSIGHGTNLQHGGNAMCFVTTPWSGELYTQTVKRLHRSGQTNSVIVHRLVCARTWDEVVVRKQSGKYKTQAALIQDLKRL